MLVANSHGWVCGCHIPADPVIAQALLWRLLIQARISSCIVSDGEGLLSVTVEFIVRLTKVTPPKNRHLEIAHCHWSKTHYLHQIQLGSDFGVVASSGLGN